MFWEEYSENTDFKPMQVWECSTILLYLTSYLTFLFKVTTETLEKGVKWVQS